MSFDLKLLNGDIVIQSDGDVLTLSNNEKLRQDIVKILLTDLGENKFHPNYGSAFGALNIGVAFDEKMFYSDIESSVEDSLTRLINYQKEQQKRQYLTPGERLISINKVFVESDEVDPRILRINIIVTTGELTTITETVSIRIA